MKVGTGGNLGLSREYHKQLFGPLFYTWWDCPLRNGSVIGGKLIMTIQNSWGGDTGYSEFGGRGGVVPKKEKGWG